ncbi:MAG: hypothetical protein A2277_14035 [Desulfobacterales bacterium RIFOXYA12_FULL_46_15]|nr:MAG: hypothetical protein A2097_08605 [Desulfobacula sp. GWF2_41_7]OGR23481.1 MAG: hypothetical protein A2277_14035 [Desulfobacterales bacterium RIFOXYA12_FULL_46_15]
MFYQSVIFLEFTFTVHATGKEQVRIMIFLTILKFFVKHGGTEKYQKTLKKSYLHLHPDVIEGFFIKRRGLLSGWI